MLPLPHCGEAILEKQQVYLRTFLFLISNNSVPYLKQKTKALFKSLPSRKVKKCNTFRIKAYHWTKLSASSKAIPVTGRGSL
jgi:hypothetical protein